MARKKRSKNARTKQIGTYLTPELLQRIHALQRAMNESQRLDAKLWQVIEMLIERGYRFTDPATGQLKMPASLPTAADA